MTSKPLHHALVDAEPDDAADRRRRRNAESQALSRERARLLEKLALKGWVPVLVFIRDDALEDRLVDERLLDAAEADDPEQRALALEEWLARLLGVTSDRLRVAKLLRHARRIDSLRSRRSQC